jgi:ribosomal protein S18 acetylase RimI-like enzyme
MRYAARSFGTKREELPMPDGTVTAVSHSARVITAEEAERRIDEIISLVGLLGRETMKEHVRKALESRHATLIGVIDPSQNRLVGIALGIVRPHLSGKDYYIGNVAVAPEFRRRGIATAMVDTLVHLARAAKCQKIELTSSRPEAHAVYANLGFSTSASQLFRLVL